MLALPQISIGFVCAGLMGGGGLLFMGNQKLVEEEKQMTSEEGLNNFFVENHRVELADGDEFIESLWLRTRPQLQIALKTKGLGNLAKIDSKTVGELDNVIGAEVNKLRRLASPLQGGDGY